MFDAWMLAQDFNGGEAAEGGLVGTIIMFAFLGIMLLTLAGMWRVFSKAGQPGWGIFVPIYNVLLMCKVAGRPAWWLIPTLLLAPIFVIILSIDIAKRFGKGAGFGLGLAFLPFPFYPMLGFSGAQYGGGSTAGGDTFEQDEVRDAA
jgi:hypothetical protein